MVNFINRKSYAAMYGPSIGDKIRLADTELFIEIEKDYTSYGEEVKFGGGKVIRDGMGQSQIIKRCYGYSYYECCYFRLLGYCKS